MNSRPGPDVYNPRGTPYGAAAEWDPTIASLADLASVATSWLQPPVIRGWVQASDTSEQVWQLLNSTAATVAGVSQRPNDYNSDNQKVWFKAGGSSYALPIASNSVLGGIKVGANLSIDGNGVLNAAAGGGGTWGSITGTLSAQTDLQSALDGKQPLAVNLTSLAGLTYGTHGQLLIMTAAGIFGLTDPYALPIASGSVLGGIKVGSGLAIDGSGVLSSTYSYSLPVASPSVLGGIKVGSGLAIDGSGVLSSTYSYSLPVASPSVLGGVKTGSRITIDGSGVASPDVQLAATFVLAIGQPATVGANKTNSYIVTGSRTIVKAYAQAKTGPLGASLIFDIKKNGTSIWNATPANRLSIASGQSYASVTAFDTTVLAENDLLTIDIAQIGSSTPGQDITVVLQFK